jgi:hypothetical protein
MGGVLTKLFDILPCHHMNNVMRTINKNKIVKIVYIVIHIYIYIYIS